MVDLNEVNSVIYGVGQLGYNPNFATNTLIYLKSGHTVELRNSFEEVEKLLTKGETENGKT